MTSTFIPKAHSSIRTALAAWLAAGGRIIGQVAISISETATGYRLTHVDDSATEVASLIPYDRPEKAREIAKYTAEGIFRPVKTAPTLIRGWVMEINSLAALQLSLEFFYPAALGLALRLHKGEISPTPLQEFFGRQTGMYRITGLVQAAEAKELAAKTCADTACQRRCLWPWAADQPLGAFAEEKASLATDFRTHWPLYCVEPCPALVGEIRTTVRNRVKAAEAAKAH